MYRVYSSMQKISVLGGLPNPVGGVTGYIYRLVNKHPELIDGVIDLYPHQHKEKISMTHKIFTFPMLIRLFFYFLLKQRGAVYFNFSGAKGLLIIALIPKITKRKWALTLHNGNLQLSNNKIVRSLMKRGLHKLDLIGVLSEKQKLFYTDLGVDPIRLKVISTYINPKIDWQPDRYTAHLQTLIDWKKEGCTLFVINGFPTKIYQHLEVIDLFQELWDQGHRSLRLAVFLYGMDHDQLLTSILIKIKH